MKIIFQKDDLIVVQKPAGVLSVPARTGAEDPRPVAGLLLQEQLGQKVFPVHRLDFEVEGMLVFALSEQAHRMANRWFENKEIKKFYQALTPVIDVQVGDKFTWKCQLLRGKKRAYESPHGKSSETHARVLEYVTGPTPATSMLRWELEPVTGRSHQLRYEMFRHQCPIIGDQLYGSQIPFKDSAIALCAYKYLLPFPVAGQTLELEIPVPF